MSDSTIRRQPSSSTWILAYLVSPALPFLCLLYARAIHVRECIGGIFASLIVHIGLMSVLAKTKGQPLQGFIVLLLMAGLYAVVFWQYLLGHRAGLWSAKAENLWGSAGRIFAALITVALMLAIIRFHTSGQAV